MKKKPLLNPLNFKRKSYLLLCILFSLSIFAPSCITMNVKGNKGKHLGFLKKKGHKKGHGKTKKVHPGKKGK